MGVKRRRFFRRTMVEGDDLWIAEQQVAWWLTIGHHLADYAAHTPDCRLADRDDLHDSRCSCGLLDVLADVDKAIECTMVLDTPEVAEVLAARRRQ